MSSKVCDVCQRRDACMASVLSFRPTLCELDRMTKSVTSLDRSHTKNADAERRIFAYLYLSQGLQTSSEIMRETDISPRTFRDIQRKKPAWLEGIGGHAWKAYQIDSDFRSSLEPDGQ